ncbi:MAG: fibrobacter succinogenes major paralogous domain-containing protein [Balneolia bacterium]|nr:fibrobacter succinogenes major paralogous domain-containing protein [Balneolia bacterium]
MRTQATVIPILFAAPLFLMYACVDLVTGPDNPEGSPDVRIVELVEVSDTSFEVTAEVRDAGEAEVTARGVCIDTEPSPGLDAICLEAGAGLGSFTVVFENLAPETEYFVKAYATNELGTAFSEAETVETLEPLPVIVTDIDGNEYETRVYGNQRWFTQNLDASTFANGDTIPLVEPGFQWANTREAARSIYQNNPETPVLFGQLYNWYAASDSRNICPDEWRVASDEDWKELEMFFGLPENQVDIEGARGANINLGGIMRLEGDEFWVQPNQGATNETGFSAVGGGFRDFFDGGFRQLGFVGAYWTSTEELAEFSWRRSLFNNDPAVERRIERKTAGFAVRCVQDVE